MPDPRAGRDGIMHRPECHQPPCLTRAEGHGVVRSCPECGRAAAFGSPFADPEQLMEDT